MIEHLMIDGRFQEWGLGRAALLAAVERLRRSGAGEINLSHHPGNPAAGLYGSLGFSHTGEKWDGEDPVMALATRA
jgi:ribosomal protein S18 acetylase RimI-like enzyme